MIACVLSIKADYVHSCFNLCYMMQVVANCTFESHLPTRLVKYFFQIIPVMIKANKWQYLMVEMKLLLQCSVI